MGESYGRKTSSKWNVLIKCFSSLDLKPVNHSKCFTLLPYSTIHTYSNFAMQCSAFPYMLQFLYRHTIWRFSILTSWKWHVRFPLDMLLRIEANMNFCFIRTYVFSSWSWHTVPEEWFSARPVPLHGLCSKAEIGGVLQWWLSLSKLLLSPWGVSGTQPGWQLGFWIPLLPKSFSPIAWFSQTLSSKKTHGCSILIIWRIMEATVYLL